MFLENQKPRSSGFSKALLRWFDFYSHQVEKGSFVTPVMLTIVLETVNRIMLVVHTSDIYFFKSREDAISATLKKNFKKIKCFYIFKKLLLVK